MLCNASGGRLTEVLGRYRSGHYIGSNERYAWLNNGLCAMTGEVRPRKHGEGFEVVFDVAELVWEPLQ